MLTQQLRELEEDRIVDRKVYNQVPPKSRIFIDRRRKIITGNLSCNVGLGKELD